MRERRICLLICLQSQHLTMLHWVVVHDPLEWWVLSQWGGVCPPRLGFWKGSSVFTSFSNCWPSSRFLWCFHWWALMTSPKQHSSLADKDLVLPCGFEKYQGTALQTSKFGGERASQCLSCEVRRLEDECHTVQCEASVVLCARGS